MLTITADAAEAIRTVLDSAELPESAGVRISAAPQSSNGTGPSVAVGVAPAPDADDEILEGEGAQVFLAPEAAPVVSDKTLDADYEPGGEITFSLRDQA